MDAPGFSYSVGSRLDRLKRALEATQVARRDCCACCGLGERSAHTWFVLSELLGYENVRDYDGVGQSRRLPIEKGA